MLIGLPGLANLHRVAPGGRQVAAVLRGEAQAHRTLVSVQRPVHWDASGTCGVKLHVDTMRALALHLACALHLFAKSKRSKLSFHTSSRSTSGECCRLSSN